MLLYVGVCVIEMMYMVMGLMCGMLFVDFGVEVIKIELIVGDSMWVLCGFGVGFFGMFNCNKKSFVVDVKDLCGLEIVWWFVVMVDVFSENFKSGMMDWFGFGYVVLDVLNLCFVYVLYKGFLLGLYEYCIVFDEVV